MFDMPSTCCAYPENVFIRSYYIRKCAVTAMTARANVIVTHVPLIINQIERKKEISSLPISLGTIAVLHLSVFLVTKHEGCGPAS